MKKFVASLLVVFFVVGFAQGAPKKVLSSGDINAFIVNFTAIETEIEALDGKFEEVLDSADIDDDTPVQESFSLMRNLKMPAEIEAVFEKNGLGANGFEKMIVITTGFNMLEMEEQMSMYVEQYQNVPEMEAYLEEIKKVTTDLRNSIHDDDYTLVKSRKADLSKAFANDE